MYRRQAGIPQKDMAYLLNMEAGNLSRYEKNRRIPTPEVILTYHILLGTDITDLLHQQYVAVVENILTRSKKLLAQMKLEQAPRSEGMIAYLESKVKELSEQDHG